jgi:hypothetical protein
MSLIFDNEMQSTFLHLQVLPQKNLPKNHKNYKQTVTLMDS